MAENKDNQNILFSNRIFPEAEPLFTYTLKPVKEIKDDCYVILDTNALLVPYTTSNESLKEIEKTYDNLIGKKRLIIPAQVAREFANNRANKIAEIYQQLSQKRDSIQSVELGIYPLLIELDKYKEAQELRIEINNSIKKFRDSIGGLLAHIRDWTWNDPVSLIYAELFKGEVIKELSFSDEEIKKDCEFRWKYKIPPGYKDSSKTDGGIGDILIWQTILEIGKEYKKDLIFVSGDEKSDWWHRSNKRALFPRYELVDEYRRNSSGKSFHIIEFSTFLELYGASDTVVEEVKNSEQWGIIKPGYSKITSFTIGSVEYKINGQPAYMDVAPYIRDGLVFLPVRYLMEALGVEVQNIFWESSNNKLTIIRGSVIIQLILDSNIMLVNGMTVEMSASPEIVLERFMIPPLYITQALGGNIEWDEATQTISIII